MLFRSLRIVKVFWGLDYALSYRRHFPAINWLNSYSLYQDKIDTWLIDNIEKGFAENRKKAMNLLQDESELEEIVRLVVRDTLSEKDQLKLEAAKSLREDYLQQNAFHDVDTFCSLNKQNKMFKVILSFYDEGNRALEQGVYLKDLMNMEVREKIARAKYINEEDIDSIDDIRKELVKEIADLISKGGVLDA